MSLSIIILAAGKGTRVRPITHTIPKPMIPILQKPVMEFLLELLRQHGFTEIMVNVSHLAEEIENYFRDGQRFGVQIAYSFEGRIEDGELTPPHSAYHDIDDSMIKRELLAKRDDPYISTFFHLAVDKRPEWQLYNVAEDPECLDDLSGKPEFAALFAEYKAQLTATLKDTGDPRLLGYGHVWEDYPRMRGQMRYFPAED